MAAVPATNGTFATLNAALAPFIPTEHLRSVPPLYQLGYVVQLLTKASQT